MQGQLFSMAQSCLGTFMGAMKALQDAKRPPVRILKVQAGENVAIQINENTNILEASYAPQPPTPGKRRMLPESTPATAEAAGENTD